MMMMMMMMMAVMMMMMMMMMMLLFEISAKLSVVGRLNKFPFTGLGDGRSSIFQVWQFCGSDSSI